MKSKILGLLAVGLLAGPVAAGAVVIDFDGTGAPCCFVSTTELTTLYSASGVTFAGVGGAGGSILNQSGNFGFNARSGTDFYAFNTDITSRSADLLFASTVTSVSIWAADRFGSTFTMEGFDSGGTLIASASLAGSTTWQELSLTGAFSRVRLTNLNSYAWAYDDLAFSVPEPGTLALLGLGLAGLGFARRRKAA